MSIWSYVQTVIFIGVWYAVARRSKKKGGGILGRHLAGIGAGWGVLLVFGALLAIYASARDAYAKPSVSTVQTTPTPFTAIRGDKTKEPERDVAADLLVSYYSEDDDGEYGYQPAITDEDRTKGIVAKTLIIFRYLGEKDGTYSVEQRGITTSIVSSCKAPCAFIKDRFYASGILHHTEMVNNEPGSIIWEVMTDAQRGNLTVYKRKP